MTGKLALAICIAVVLSSMVATADETTVPSLIKFDTSVYSHSIHNNADAHSEIFESNINLKPDLGIGIEAAKVSDVAGRTVIGNVYVRQPIPLKIDERASLEGYAGISWLSVKDIFDSHSGSTGISLGVLADYSLRPDLILYSRAGVALLDESLWTLDAGMRYEIRPLWYITMGYRDYVSGGSSFGGFLVGATYRGSL